MPALTLPPEGTVSVVLAGPDQALSPVLLRSGADTAQDGLIIN
jgi:hypothetical protein